MERPWHKFWPKGLPKRLEYPSSPLWKLLQLRAAQDATALVARGTAFSFRDLWKAADGFASLLKDSGILPGMRCVLSLPNSPAFIAAYFGILRAGCVAVPLNPLLKREEIEPVIADTSPAAAVFSPDRAEEHGFLRNPPCELIFVADCSPDIRKARHEPVRPAPESSTGDPDIAVIQQTGGTTGIRKGAMMTHANLVANAVQNASWFGWTERDVVMGLLPFCHTWGLSTCVNSPLVAGAKVVAIERYEPDKVLQAVEEHRVTVWYGAASLFNMLLNHPALKGAKLSSLRYVKAGAMPVPESLAKRWEDATGVKFVTGYGLTEASPETHNNPLDRVKSGTIGIPLPDTDARIVDPEDTSIEVPPGSSGELLIMGPQVMKGYWNRREETDQAFADGWLRTGDIACMDDEGYFRIVDRRKDLIKYKGHSIFPCELENALYSHPAVRECAVIGRPDAEAGEIPKAFVVLKDGARAGSDELIEHCAGRISPQKKVREVEFIREIPKNPVGKVLRRRLRALDSPLSRMLSEASRIAAFTGAGVSAESGIPTYRGENGLWTKYDPGKFASIIYFRKDPAYYWNFFKNVRLPMLKSARPGPTHLALARLEAAGRLTAVITQNIDGLHQMAGSRRVLELHGNSRRFVCTKCPARYSIERIEELLTTQLCPICEKCGALLRPDVVFFGECLPEDVLVEAFEVAGGCDLMLALGSSLVVHPAAAVPMAAKERGARLVIINKGGTPLDVIADVVLDAAAGDSLGPAIEELL
jgi:long-chain acyl-CoA synthetase